MAYADPQKAKEYLRQYYLKNKERKLKLCKEWASCHKQQRVDAVRRWRERHPEKAKELHRLSNLRRKDKNNEQRRRQRVLDPSRFRAWEKARQERLKADPEAMARRKETQRKYYLRNREEKVEQAKVYAKCNRVKLRLVRRIASARRRTRSQAVPGFFDKAKWLLRLAFYGYRCVYCERELTESSATIDHLIPVAAKGPNWPCNLVPACGPCNFSKGSRFRAPKWLERRCQRLA